MGSNTQEPPVEPVHDEAAIKSHIEQLTAAQLPNSAIYNFLLSDVRIVSASKGSMTARLTLTRNHINSGGGIHGAVSAAIVDWAGGMAIATWDLRRRTGVSVDIHVTYLSSAVEGDEIEITSTADKVGGSLAFTRIVISKVIDGKAGPVIANGSHTKYAKQR
ncbi:thioesterase family protein [Hypomontagnella monticulosa]|nr:thioesterase family protein [Hypomontagnella monticulosa]